MRLGDDGLYCVQLSYKSANFGEHNLTADFGDQGMTGQEARGIKDTAPSLSEVESTTIMVRPAINNREVPINILLEQRQNLMTDEELHEEYSRMIDSTGSAGTPS